MHKKRTASSAALLSSLDLLFIIERDNPLVNNEVGLFFSIDCTIDRAMVPIR